VDPVRDVDPATEQVATVSVVDHLLLGVAAVAVWGASFRLASTFVDRGLERILVAGTFFTAAIVVEAMALGLISLGGTQAALVVAAVAMGLLALVLLPRSAVKVGGEFAVWLERTPTTAIVSVSAAVGLGIVWLGWALWSPVVGVDGVYYHLPQIVRWIHEGSPGSVDYINYIYPVGNYPLTNAVAQAWGLGISRSMVMVSIWPIFNMTVLVLAGWVGLRRLRLSVAVRVLAILAVATTPVALIELAGPLNDLPALSWLACGAALVVCSKDAPRLLVPAVVAVGIAIGTKTIALPLGVVILVGGVILHRRSLRPMARPLAVGFGVFLVVGSFWYVRDLVDHGSPFWPWSSSPWGDPVPPFLDQTYASFLSAPRYTLEGRYGLYASWMAGAVVLILGALALAAVRRDRSLRWMGALLFGLLFLWAAAPSTAKAAIFDGSVSQTRYLLPVIGLAAALVALASRGSRRWELLTLGTLSIALIWNLAQVFTGAFPTTAPELAIIIGVVVGAAIGALVGETIRGPFWFPSPLTGAGVAAVAASLLALPAANWVSHHGDQRANFDAGLAKYLAARDDFRDGDEPIWMTPLLVGPLAGDQLQHDVRLIPPTMPCSQVAGLREDGWVIIRKEQIWVDAIGYTVGGCLKEEPPLAEVDGFRIYQPQQEGAAS
jgi:hypothetical protein